MKKFFIITGTVTYAARGRNMLQRHGFPAHIERSGADLKSSGCGYGIVVSGDREKAIDLLRSGGVKILGVTEYGSVS